MYLYPATIFLFRPTLNVLRSFSLARACDVTVSPPIAFSACAPIQPGYPSRPKNALYPNRLCF